MVFSKRSVLLLCIATVVFTNAINGEVTNGGNTHSQHKVASNTRKMHTQNTHVKSQNVKSSDIQVNLDADTLKNNDVIAEIEYDGDESMDIVLSPEEVQELMQGDELVLDIQIVEPAKEKHMKQKPSKGAKKKVQTQKKAKKVSPKKQQKIPPSKQMRKVKTKSKHPSKKQEKKDAHQSNEQVKQYPYGSVTYVTKSSKDKKMEVYEKKETDTNHEAKAETTELSVQTDNSENLSTKNGPTVVFAGIIAAAVMTVGTVAAVIKRSRSVKESTEETVNDVEDLDNLDQLESSRASKTSMKSNEGMKVGDSDLETEGNFIHGAVAV